MSTLQEQPTPALVIHRWGQRQYMVLPADVDSTSEDAKSKALLISSRKACESYVNERVALAEAHAAAAPQPQQQQHAATRVDLPVIEVQHVEGEGHYVLVNQKQIARFDGPTAYDDATRCCAVLVQNEIAKLEQQQPYQVRYGNTGRVLSAHPTIDAANEVAWSIENGSPYAGVPAANLAVEFWQRQPDGQYRQMTPGQVERGLEAGKPELAEHEQYRRELVERARAAYPNATPELAARIDKEISRRSECVKTYQQHLEKVAADSFPTATPEERQKHQANIKAEVHSYRLALEKHIVEKREQRQQEQAQQPPARVRQQSQGRALSR